MSGCAQVDDEPHTVFTSAPSEFSNSTSASFQFSAGPTTRPCVQARRRDRCLPPGGLQWPGRRPPRLRGHCHRPVRQRGDNPGRTELDDRPGESGHGHHIRAGDDDRHDIGDAVRFRRPGSRYFEQHRLRATGSCGSPTTYSNLATGAHTVSVRTVDRAGNRDPSPAALAFTVSAPTGTFTKTPAGNLVLIAGKAVKISKRGYASVALNCSGPRDCAGR